MERCLAGRGWRQLEQLEGEVGVRNGWRYVCGRVGVGRDRIEGRGEGERGRVGWGSGGGGVGGGGRSSRSAIYRGTGNVIHLPLSCRVAPLTNENSAVVAVRTALFTLQVQHALTPFWPPLTVLPPLLSPSLSLPRIDHIPSLAVYHSHSPSKFGHLDLLIDCRFLGNTRHHR